MSTVSTRNNDCLDVTRLSISLRSLQKMQSFVTTMLMQYETYYQMPALSTWLRVGAICSLWGASMYESDSEIEAAQREKTWDTGVAPFVKRLDGIRSVLTEVRVYDAAIEARLLGIQRYFDLENEMRKSQASSLTALHEMLAPMVQDIMVSHHICHNVLEKPFTAPFQAAIEALEMGFEMETNLIEYADDLANNDFNYYRAFVQLYGPAAPDYYARERERHWQTIEARLAELPPISQQALRQAIARWKEISALYYTTVGGKVAAQTQARQNNMRLPFPFPIPTPVLE